MAKSLTTSQKTTLRRALLAWYRAAARDLPWRRDPTPYRVWVSEIMLQQTQVATVVPYFERFMKAFPSVDTLAAAPLDRVYKLWEGLGYYRRAKHLHQAAQHVAAELGGEFPESAEAWQRLPGVGRYTAAAIASITTGEPVAVVDGNVQRVLTRMAAIDTPLDARETQAELWSLAQALLPQRSAGDFNQAMMELGARICRPRRPQCEACPVARWCQARAEGRQAEFPVKLARKQPLAITAVAAIAERRGKLLVVKRPHDGLLGGLWALPTFELVKNADPADVLRRELRQSLRLTTRPTQDLGIVTHAFTHRRLTLHVWRMGGVSGRLSPVGDIEARWVSPAQAAALAMGGPFRKALVLVAEQTKGFAFAPPST